MTQTSKIIKNITEEIKKLTDQNQKIFAVFDLDSTLFDVSPRLEQILIDFASLPEHQKKFPEQIPHFKNIKTLRTDWGISNALIRSGLDGHHPEFQKAVKEFWTEKFFTNEYLHYDKPYEGAVDFVNSLYNLGVDISYLTGRDVERMHKGSREVLLKWKFPLDDKQAVLALKPHKSMDDAEFKKDYFLDIPKNKYSKVYFFENEPVNIELVQKHCNFVDIFFFESTHSGKAEVSADMPKILNYLIKQD